MIDQAKNLNIPDVNLKRIVIVGGGFAGLNLAKKLHRQNYQVVLIDKHNYHTFQPLLYQVATAGLEPDSIAHALRTILQKKKNFYFRFTKVLEINQSENFIQTEIGQLTYDFLVIATGSKTNFFGNKEIEESTMAMKNIPEALDLRSVILQNFEEALLTNDLLEREKLMNFVIVGGGPTGVELAGALIELKNHILPHDYPDLDIRKMDVHLVQSADRLLPSMSEKSSEQALKYLQNEGVLVWLNTRVLNYNGSFVDTNNKDLFANTMIWTAGVEGELISGFMDEQKQGNRYLCDEYCKIKHTTNIFAIGDIAAIVTEANPKGDPMVAQVAIQQGKYLGQMFYRLSNSRKILPFKYHDKGSMATVGRNKAVVDLPGGMHFSGFIAWLIWMFVHLVSLVGFRNKVIALMNWIIQYFSYNKSVRLIIRPYKKKYS